MQYIKTGEHTFHPLAPSYRRGDWPWDCETADSQGNVYIIRWDADTLLYGIFHKEEKLHTALTMRQACNWVADHV